MLTVAAGVSCARMADTHVSGMRCATRRRRARGVYATDVMRVHTYLELRKVKLGCKSSHIDLCERASDADGEREDRRVVLRHGPCAADSAPVPEYDRAQQMHNTQITNMICMTNMICNKQHEAM